MDRNPTPNLQQATAIQREKITLVWDLPLRFFHWAMVCVVIIAGITGFIAPPWWLDVHVIAGYALAILITFRVIWGFLGSYYSRFGTFPLALAGVFKQLRLLLDKKSEEHTGHNPVGAWMIVALLLVLVLLVLSGIVVLGGQENLGPLASETSYLVGKVGKALHELAAWALLGAITIHLLGVFVETKVFRHSVIKAMITGKKITADVSVGSEAEASSSANANSAVGAPAGTHAIRGFLLLLAIGGLLIGGGMKLADKPASGWRAVEVPPSYTSECGDCHNAYHPSLRTKVAWQAIMNGLADHYGEDATIDEDATKTITSYLIANAAETFDTQVSHVVGRADTPSFRMTDTPYWKDRHHEIDKAVFSVKDVGSKVNCSGCHKDAASGHFANIKIQLPTGDKK